MVVLGKNKTSWSWKFSSWDFFVKASGRFPLSLLAAPVGGGLGAILIILRGVQGGGPGGPGGPGGSGGLGGSGGVPPPRLPLLSPPSSLLPLSDGSEAEHIGVRV